MELHLLRTYYPTGTNGRLLHEGSHIAHTIELPWQNNLTGVSCIPEGTYRLRTRYSTRFGLHLEVENVPGRDCILIHPANDALKELKGCISPVTFITGRGKGVLSRQACAKLNLLVNDPLASGESVLLTIKIQPA